MHTAIVVLKLIIVLLFLFLSSKSLGILLNKKFKITYETSLGIGYLSNIALFFMTIFIPMYFKLSTNMMMAFGGIYLIICIFSIYYVWKEKELWKFSKKEIIALVIALIFSILYAFFIDFGYAEMYDSYFYSILSNSVTNTKHLATINPYTGVGDLQNFYKYISYYYQAGFLGNVMSIKPAYLVLIWPFTFMNYYLLSITALGVVRVTKKEYINNMLSIFVLAFYNTIFRSPFNALHLVNLIIPIYMMRYIFKCFDNKKYLYLYYIIFLAATAISSTILYTSAVVIAVIFITNSYTKKRNYETVFKLAIPTYLLGIIYLTEANRNIFLILLLIAILFVIYYLLKLKFVNIILKYTGILLTVLLPTLFILAPRIDNLSNYTALFMRQGVVADKMATYSDNLCIEGNIIVDALNTSDATSKFSTAMQYIYNDSSSLINRLFIYSSYSVFLYGGMLFYFIYGFLKLKKDPRYKGFLIYLLLFFNPLVYKGVAILTLNLNNRIYLFMNTYFALLGLRELFNFLSSIKKEPYKNYLKYILKYAYIFHAILLCGSIITYIGLLKQPNWKENNFLYKVPNDLVETSNDLDNIFKPTKKKPNVLYAIDTFNLTMIAKDPNTKYNIIDSKEYMSYYFNPLIINNKMLMSLYFNSNGDVTYNNIKDNIKEKEGDIIENNCEITNMLESYKTKYIVISDENKDVPKLLETKYKSIYNKNHVIVLQRSE